MRSFFEEKIANPKTTIWNSYTQKRNHNRATVEFGSWPETKHQHNALLAKKKTNPRNPSGVHVAGEKMQAKNRFDTKSDQNPVSKKWTTHINTQHTPKTFVAGLQ